MKNIFIMLFLFFFVSTIFLGSLMYIQEVLGDSVVSNFTEVGESLITQTNYKNNITEIGQTYISGDAKFDYDSIFIIMFFIMEIGIIVLSILSPKLPKWSFLTFLVFFTIMFNMAYSYMIDINQWFYTEFIVDIFDATTTYMPWYIYILNNQLGLVFLNIIGSLGINFIWGRKEISPFTRGDA